MFEKYTDELRKYLRFLISFANLSEDFRQKQIYLDLEFDKIQVDYAKTALIYSEVSIEVS